MHPSKPTYSGADVPKYTKWMNWWGHIPGPGQVGQAQRGIITYSLSPNQVAINRGAFREYAKWFFIRTGRHAWAWLPPFLGYYYIVDWAKKRNHYLSTKDGFLKEGGQGE